MLTTNFLNQSTTTTTATRGVGGGDHKMSHTNDARSGETHRVEEEEEEEDDDTNGNGDDEHQERLKQRSTDSFDYCETASCEEDDDGCDHEHFHQKEKRDDSLMLARKETRAVGAGKCLVLVALIVASSTMAVLTYWFIKQGERQTFETDFANTATQLLNAANRNVEQTMNIIESIATAVTAYASRADVKWPYVTIPDFEIQTRDIRALSGSQLIFFTPVINNETLEGWGLYSALNQGWIQEGLHVMDNGYQLDDDHVENHTDAGTIPPFLHTLQGDKVPPSPSGLYAPLWQYSPTPLTADFVNLDLFHTFPEFERLTSEVRMFRLPTFSEPIDMNAILSSTTTANGGERDSPQQQQQQKENFHSLLIYPVFETFVENAPIRGFMAALVPWEEYFENVLQVDKNHHHRPQQQKQQQQKQMNQAATGVSDSEDAEEQQQEPLPPVVVEMQEVACYNIQKTFIVQGSIARFVGDGLLHDRQYQSLGRTAPFATFTHDTSSSTSTTELPCLHDFRLTVYPTAELENHYHTHQPAFFTAMVLAIFVFTAAIFILYDYLVGRRQNIVMNTAVKSTALVASLFPATVQDRILEQQHQQQKSNAVESSIMKSSARSHADSNTKNRNMKSIWGERYPTASPNGTPTTALTNDINNVPETADGGGAGADGSNASSRTILRKRYNDQPIADLFPETTVFFCDIVGFTAWSSAREPAQVFVLLETVYGHFDDVAKRRNVFKIETVGDCYVAVTGLPTARKDHAVVMVRFATDCISTFREVTRELEKELGPDTGDLNIRVGMHSGPVTAGVLRGERARFQLFGDTMNTASRMESNGKAGCIHVSAETAQLLIGAGKAHWITPREEKIVAKGKGELQTYWVQVRSGSGGASGSNGSRSSHGCTPVSPIDLTICDVKVRSNTGTLFDMPTILPEKVIRLVDWNVDVLIRLLRSIEARRLATASTSSASAAEMKLHQKNAPRTVLEEVKEIIELPSFDASVLSKEVDPYSIHLSPEVEKEARDYVTAIAYMYRDNPFHNFEHCSHVAMSVSKLLSRIVAPSDVDITGEKARDEASSTLNMASTLHDHTYGITSDPLTHFACVFSALIHDVDHSGVPNMQLVKENPTLAARYHNKSVAEQNSVDLAWDLLMDQQYTNFRRAIFATPDELQRFRQLVVNSVMATDIMDQDLKALRNARWEKAFSDAASVSEQCSSKELDRNRKATIVIEHIIQASDVSHTMQHWHIYRKWNERLFMEMYRAYKDGRAAKDPSQLWYEGEIGFFDYYIIPLAEKLEACGVFGVSSFEYLNYAQRNRAEWESRGRQVVEEMMAKIHQSEE